MTGEIIGEVEDRLIEIVHTWDREKGLKIKRVLETLESSVPTLMGVPKCGGRKE